MRLQFKKKYQSVKSFDKEAALIQVERYLRYELGQKPVSVRVALSAIRKLIEHYGVTVPGPDTGTLIKEQMMNAGTSNSTINKNLYYLEYLAAALGHPQKYAKLSEKIKKRRKALSMVEVAKVLEVAKTRSSRDHAIIAVFVYAGLRKMELCNLNLADVDLTHSLLWVNESKNNVEDAAIISIYLAPILRQWLRDRPAIESTALFFSSTGRRFTEKSMHRLVSEICAEAGVHGYPHLLRHSCGSSIIKSGGNILDAKRQLRHKSLRSTEGYLSGDDESTRANLGKLHY